MTARVGGTGSGIMLFYAFVDVCGNADIQTVVDATKDVYVPLRHSYNLR